MLISAFPLTCITKVTHTPLLSTDTCTWAAHTHTHRKDFFCLRHAISFFIHRFHLSSSLSPSASLLFEESWLRKKKKKKTLSPALSPSTPFSCIFCYLAAVCLLSVWCGGWGGRGGRKSGGEAKLGAQGYNRKTRAGGEGRGLERMGSSGVAHGEQRYLINTNARSKLFRQGL